MVKPRSIPAALGCLLMIAVGSAHAAEGASPKSTERHFQNTCARCHSIEATGDSPLRGAPPLREVYLKYPIEMLQYDLAEGFGSKHRDMPRSSSRRSKPTRMALWASRRRSGAQRGCQPLPKGLSHPRGSSKAK